jgi:hypothetical protein
MIDKLLLSLSIMNAPNARAEEAVETADRIGSVIRRLEIQGANLNQTSEILKVQLQSYSIHSEE